MRAILIRLFLVGDLLAIAWFLGARRLSLLLDRVSTKRVSTLPIGALRYDHGSLEIGEYPMFISPNCSGAEFLISPNSEGRLVLSSGGRSFIMGPRTRPPDTSGRSDIEFAPDLGDELTLSLNRSWTSWMTPFEMNLMTGRAPKWKRHPYYKLVWKKPSGAKLTLVWRYEQLFYKRDGWASVSR